MKVLATAWLFILSTAAYGAPRKSDFSVVDTRAVAYAYAKCVVKRRSVQAREVILANHANSVILKSYPALANADCLGEASIGKTSNGVEMRFPGDLIRYGLADALFAKDLVGVPPRDLSHAAPLAHNVVDEQEYKPEAGKKLSKRRAEEMERRFAIARGSTALSHFGECVVRGDGINSHALLSTNPSSVEEGRAFQSLQPAFATCLSSGNTFKTNRSMMRGTIAINYYRLAFAPRISNAEVSR